MAEARNEFIGIEHMTDSEIEKIRDDLEAECGEAERWASHEAVERLQLRR